MKKTLALFLMLFVTLPFAQKRKDFLISYTSGKGLDERYGYKTRNGKIVIKAQYQSVNTDTLYNMAIVLKNWQWAGVDRQGKIILIPYIYDNGPDYIEEGLFRFVENNKIGFANLDGKKVIPAKYSFTTPFKDGIAEYYIGGEEVYENGKTKKQIIKESGHEGLVDKHWIWGGAISEYGFINKFGQKFKKVSPLKAGKRIAVLWNNKKVVLNKNGKIVQ